jgi:hypothetical protein
MHGWAILATQVCCARCGTRCAMGVEPPPSGAGGGGGGSRVEAECGGCRSTLGLTLRPRFLHATSNTLAVLLPLVRLPGRSKRGALGN